MATTNFPHCIGAIDGEHIRIIKSTESGSLYFNYKKFFSIILVAICDANHTFSYIDVGGYGKSADTTIFKNSAFFTKLTKDELNIPEPRDIGIGLDDKLPYMFIADEGFSQSNFILRPFAGKVLSIDKRVFNYRLCTVRRYIECAFGILGNMWCIFHRPINVDPKLARQIIKTCCALHNFVRARDCLDGGAVQWLSVISYIRNNGPLPTTQSREGTCLECLAHVTDATPRHRGGLLSHGNPHTHTPTESRKRRGQKMRNEKLKRKDKAFACIVVWLLRRRSSGQNHLSLTTSKVLRREVSLLPETRESAEIADVLVWDGEWSQYLGVGMCLKDPILWLNHGDQRTARLPARYGCRHCLLSQVPPRGFINAPDSLIPQASH
ncbi:hypothetical protein PR048_019293 [Dryococelus australis]|uniref:DDE Tnp4 domain-containing protein n=1 Tax=Dryococelus australis TaxID=614101 RepID=A0ABQ9H3F0_9NEOP|nr:hypothetical protein PR048_019293 [Dryococelus australis]